MMSIQSEINRINTNVANTYSALNELGAEMPATQNTDNLESTVRTIKVGKTVQLTGDVTGTGSFDSSGNMVIETVAKPRVIKAAGTISSSGWSKQSNGSYTQTVTIQGVTGGSDIIVGPTTNYIEAYINASCEPIAQGTNSITFSCTSPPSTNISIELIIYNFT